MKDIFVEVDWMKKEIEGRWYADGSGGKYYVPGFTIEYRMKEGAQNKVIRPFGKHEIALHIDDGCMGGGEGNIPYKQKMSEEMKDDLFYNKSYYSKYFDSTRHGKFHHCIFADLGWLHNWNHWHGGQGEFAGDSFIVFEGDCDNSKETANCFMHELGHNLLGTSPSHLDGDGHCDDSDCSMQNDARDGEVDYCIDCWNSLYLPYVG